MKPRFTFLMTAVLIVAVLLSACQQPGLPIPSDPLEAIKTIAEKQKDVKSSHTELTLDLTLKMTGLPGDDPTALLLSNFKANLKLAGDFDNVAQDFSASGSADLGFLTSFVVPGADEIKFEVVKAGDTLYSRLEGEDWNTTDASAATSSLDTQEAFDLARLLKKAGKAARESDESVDGVDAYHFKVSLDPIELLNEISSIAGSAAGINQASLDQAAQYLKDATVEIELWIGKADLFIRQEKIHFALDLKNLPDMPSDAKIFFELSITSKASKINEPVGISAPE